MESINDTLKKYRNHWAEFRRDEHDYKAIFLVLHGILERTNPESWNEDIALYFNNTFEALKTKRNENQILNPETLIEFLKPALKLDLPVQAPKDLESISAIKGLYGVVGEIEYGKARIHFSIPEGRTDPKAPIWEGADIDVSHLPKEYQRECAWVAWIEYQFKDGRKAIGNFEPASTLDYTINAEKGRRFLED